MAITAKPYGPFLVGLLTDSSFDMETQPLYVSLVKNTYTPNYATDATASAYDGHEVDDEGTPDGYVAGGKQLQNVQVTYDVPSATAVVTADDIQWDVLTATFRYAVIYDGTGDKLVGAIDFGEDQAYTAEPLLISFPDGIVKLAAQ
jgi:hypothetical protein